MCLAGAHFRFAAERADAVSLLPHDYAAFQIPTGTTAADAIYTAASDTDQSLETMARAHIMWENELLRLWYISNQRIGIDRFDGPRKQWRLAAQVHPDFGDGILYTSTPTPTAPETIPFHHPHDRIMIVGRLAYLQGGMVHAAAVADKGRGILLVGPSGAGKTTLARLWRQGGATILNDERNFLRQDGATTWLGATPWHGEDNAINPTTVPLAAIFHLKQSQQNRLVQLTATESITRLITATFIPVFLHDGLERIMQSWSDLLEYVPAYECSFTPDARAVACGRETLGLSVALCR